MIDIEARAGYQLLTLFKDMDSWYANSHHPLRINDFEKVVEVKKPPLPNLANHISGQFF